MRVLGVDPGSEQSAWVLFESDNDGTILDHGIEGNDVLVTKLESWPRERAHVVFEQVHMGGMPAGIETFETVFWTGRFAQAVKLENPWARLRRQAVKLHLCQSVRANDGNIRQALIDRFGPTKEAAIGKRQTPGPLFGIKSHEWAALAIAVTWSDQNPERTTA